jgi:quercetin dioxygenase-like cupin family protein
MHTSVLVEWRLTTLEHAYGKSLTLAHTRSRVGSGFCIKTGELGQEAGMRPKLFCAGLLVCLAGVLARAQDPTKVEPKHYKLDFENDRVQVVSVHYGPHEKSVMHEHPGGVVVSLTEAHLRFTDENGKTREVFSKAGEVRWYPPFRHKVENLGDTTYDAVYVGIKGKLAASNNSEDPAIVLDDETKKLVAGYLLAAGKP